MSSSPFVVKWGILATGNIASKFTQDLLTNPATRDTHDVRHELVAAASSSSASRAQDFINACKGPSTAKAYGSYAELVADANIDIIYIATPHSHHFQNAMLALEAGKNVLCEKSLTVNAKQTKKLYEVAKAKKLFFMEAVWTRCFPLSVKIREMVTSGEIGDVIRVVSDLSFPEHAEGGKLNFPNENRMVNKELAGGALLDIGIYALTWVFQIMYTTQPKPREAPTVLAAIQKYAETGADEMTSMILQFPKHNAMGIALTGLRAGYKHGKNYGPAITITGTKGEIQVDGPAYCPTHYRVIMNENPEKVVEVECAIPKDKDRDNWGQGMFWEADEAARCLRDGKLESEWISWEESTLIMETMDEVRRQGGLKYPDLIESAEYDAKSPLNPSVTERHRISTTMSYGDSKAAQAALLHWVNTFPLEKEARSLVDLSDGKLLYQVMADIDPTFTRRRINEKKTFQAVIRGLRYYIVTECAELEELLESPSFIAISADGKTEDILEVAMDLKDVWGAFTDLCEQLTSFLLVAAMSGPRRQDYISTIMTFDQGVQGEIKEIIEQRITEAHEARESGNKIYQPPPSKATPDEFQLEYRYGVLLGQKRGVEQENERLLKQTADLTTRLTHLQENNDSLQDHLRDAEDRLNAPIRDDETNHRIRRLEDDIRERDEVIESQEGQLEQDRDKMARMGRELSNLKDADSRLIQLQDEIKELEFRNDELTKKANTVDRYKNKLEVQKDLQKNFKDLELENEELKAQFQTIDKLRERNSNLENSQRQYQNSISKAEMEIFEIGSQKKMLEAENSELRYSLSTHEEKIAQYEQAIFELREQSPLPEISPHGQTLAEQMQNSDADRQSNLENFRLKAENALLKGNTLAAQENASLRAQLEEADAHRKVLEGKYRESFEKAVITQQQLRAMMNLVDDNKKFVNVAMSIGALTLLTPEYYRDQAFVELKRAHESVTEQLSALQKQLTALEAEHEDAKRELLMATADLSMVEKEEIDALEELKATQESLSKSIENELTALKGKYKALEIDHEALKSQLIESLLANNKLREALEKNTNIEAEAPITDDDSKDVPATPTVPDAEEILKKDATIAELQAQVKELEENGNDVQKVMLMSLVFSSFRCPRARERQSQARVWHDDHGVVRPLQPRAEQHRDAATTERGVEELDQQAAARRESDREEPSAAAGLEYADTQYTP
ncbi:hypothetical protein V502_08218 [Pseudogymnoascus sp. VKM F-4520 (FW-2644)]|nr:hypothetical protein V502_08218 [Pseudogymnoascus sp. VKM F-4520 (FW-2644)]